MAQEQSQIDPLSNEIIQNLFFAVSPCMKFGRDGSVKKINANRGLRNFEKLPIEFFTDDAQFAYDGINFYAAEDLESSMDIANCQYITATNPDLSQEESHRWYYASQQVNNYIESFKENQTSHFTSRPL